MSKRFFYSSLLISIIILMFTLSGILSTSLISMSYSTEESSSIFYYIILIILPVTHSIFLKLFNLGKENLWIDYFLMSFLSTMSALSFSLIDALDAKSLFFVTMLFFLMPLLIKLFIYSLVFNLWSRTYIKFKAANDIIHFRMITLILIITLHIVNVIKHLVLS